ncbi:MAG: RNA polymerase sigma factor [Acidobacteria bacterium]|nr:RNA polymerase sigma factor [Acidobacteriota bacterium]
MSWNPDGPGRRRSAMTTDPTEVQLLAALRAGDRGAAETLVAASYRTIYASLYRLCGGDGELAADLTQEAYRRAWASLGRFQGEARFVTWVYRIAYNAFLNHVRRPRRLVPLDDEAPVTDPGPDLEEELLLGRESDRLRRAVLALPEDLRFTVTARFWGERSVADIADGEGITPAAVRKRLKKALHLLALALEEDSP